jgi:Fe-S-cluster-containing hydrogenase component 2
MIECGGDAIHFYPPDHDYAIVCDLCEKDGERQPQCVDVCPRHALEYMSAARRRFTYLKESHHLWRIGVDEKTRLIHNRTYPLDWDDLGITETPFSEDKGDDE